MPQNISLLVRTGSLHVVMQKKKKKKSLPQMAWKSSNRASCACVKAWSFQKVNFERKQLFGQEVLLEKMLKPEEAGGLLLSPYL